MAKSLQYTKVLDALLNANGPVPVSTIKAIDGIVPTRLSTYLWEIKRNTPYAVRPIRDGKTVVSYELIGGSTAGVAAPATVAPVAAVATTKVPRAPKAPKAKVEKPSKPTMTEDDLIDETLKGAIKNDSMVFDALDEIEPTVQDFEERSYAESYVRTL